MKKLLVFLKGYKKQSFLAPTFKMLEAIFELLVPIAVKMIIDNGVNEKDNRYVFAMCGVMILLAVIGLACALCAQFFAARAATGFATSLRSALFAKIQGFSYSVTDKLGASTLITRMTNDVNSVQTGVNMFLRLFMRSPFIVFGAMICAIIIDPMLGLIFAITILILAVVVFGIMLVNIKQNKKTQAKLDTVVSKVRGNYHGTRVVRAFNKESEEIEDFDSRIDGLKKLQNFSGRISALMNPVTYVIINFAIIILIRNGALQVDAGNISQGELIALYNYMSQILVELIKLASLIITLNKAAASADRISAVFDTPSDIEKDEKEPINKTDATLLFDDVSFFYGEQKAFDTEDALSNISFEVKAGQTVGIIGGTGSGKSTLVNLIPGLYAPTSGEVLIGGKHASALTSDDLSALFGIVPQKAVLFKGSIRSNLMWGKADATEEEMWQSLKLACADEFVKEKGLDAEVLQNGKNFSGGQRQRLTIARALIKRPQFLILDDSASALDYATESRLRKNIADLAYAPTVFIVSQRASSIMHADLILLLEDGRLVGKGRHEELLATSSLYREIYNTQFSEGGNE